MLEAHVALDTLPGSDAQHGMLAVLLSTYVKLRHCCIRSVCAAQFALCTAPVLRAAC
jgi:hypothetical protein